MFQEKISWFFSPAKPALLCLNKGRKHNKKYVK